MNENINPKKKALLFMQLGCLLFTADYLVGFVGIASVVLFFLSLKQFIHAENTHFSKAKKFAIWFAISYCIFYVIMILATFNIFSSSVTALISNISRAFATINFIYISHYFTEGVLLDAKMAKVNYIKLGLNTPWIMMGLFAMCDFFVYTTFKQPIPSICAVLSVGMAAYYWAMLNKAYPVIYEKNK